MENLNEVAEKVDEKVDEKVAENNVVPPKKKLVTKVSKEIALHNEKMKAFYVKSVSKQLGYDLERKKTTRYLSDYEREQARKDTRRRYEEKRRNMKKVETIVELFSSLTISGKVEIFVRLLQYFSAAELDHIKFVE